MKIENREALAREAEAFVEKLTPQTGATLVTLSGELGAGKTTFTQEVARVLGVGEVVTSPTFVLEKIYQLPAGRAFSRLVHIDAYRLTSGNELRALGFNELMQDSSALIVLEWPERVADALPTPTFSLLLVPNEDGSRTLTYG